MGQTVFTSKIQSWDKQYLQANYRRYNHNTENISRRHIECKLNTSRIETKYRQEKTECNHFRNKSQVESKLNACSIPTEARRTQAEYKKSIQKLNNTECIN